MRAYYGSKLSPNMTVTPEGYLVCLNVPIARTGAQQYLRSELGYTDDPNEIIDVIRTEAEVFSPATIASFEGKPVTFDHPPTSVDAENIVAYDKGHAQNVRRGSGDESDLLIADLYITSPHLIEQIKNGLREVSCGYDCEYVQDEDGRLYQRSIRGNHVAVVSAGRAGHRVAIKDSDVESETTHKERGKVTMAKKKPTNSLMARLFARAVKDMEPDEVADAIEEIAADDEEPQTPPTASDNETENPTQGDNGGEVLQQLLTAVAALTKQVEALNAAKDEEPAPAPAPADALGELEDELGGDDPGTLEDQEESHTVPADELPEETADEDEVTDEDGPEAPASSLPENPIPGADKAAALYAIKAVKPVIAALPKNQRKAASDRAAAEIRKMLGRDSKAHTNNYTAIAQTMRQSAKSRAKDSRARKVDHGELGKRIMANRNPHVKKAN